jgi:cytoskeletal protein CcmA (bactofilin family)
MFGKEPDNQNVASAGQTSIIAQGCKFDGKVDAHGTLRVEGEFKGTVGTPETLVVGKTGVIHAEVKVKNAIIGGQLYGNIQAENKIELQSGSHVEGDIKTKRLVIDEGVFFEGNCRMGDGQRRSPPTSGAASPPPPPAQAEAKAAEQKK